MAQRAVPDEVDHLSRTGRNPTSLEDRLYPRAVVGHDGRVELIEEAFELGPHRVSEFGDEIERRGHSFAHRVLLRLQLGRGLGDVE